MTAHIIGGLTVALDDGPIRTRYDRDALGKQRATLLIGEGSKEIGITIAGSPAETLAQLREAVAELETWATSRDLIKQLPEVA
ncbi:hypothetical protein ACWCRC_37255 [Streptomyces sp. NPDC001940]